MKRRRFLSAVGSGLALGAVNGPANLFARVRDGTSDWPSLRCGVACSPTTGRPYAQRPTFLDAMGEIRLTHSMDLLREVLASGTRAVTVSLPDPKVFGEAALDAALDDLLAYDRHIREHSEVLLKATSVADIDRARREGRLALLYLLQNSTPIHSSPW